MPRIKTSTLGDHREQMWTTISDSLELVLRNRRPFATVTLAEVAAASGIARNSIYTYAKDIDSLIISVTKRVTVALSTEVENSYENEKNSIHKILAIASSVLRWFAEGPHRTIVATCFSGPLSDVARHDASIPLKSIEETSRKIIREGIKAGEIRDLRSVDFTHELIASMMSVAVIRVIHHPSELQVIEKEIVYLICESLSLQ